MKAKIRSKLQAAEPANLEVERGRKALAYAMGLFIMGHDSVFIAHAVAEAFAPGKPIDLPHLTEVIRLYENHEGRMIRRPQKLKD